MCNKQRYLFSGPVERILVLESPSALRGFGLLIDSKIVSARFKRSLGRPAILGHMDPHRFIRWSLFDPEQEGHLAIPLQGSDVDIAQAR